MYILGQVLGFIAVILGFISFQMKTHKKLMIMQTALSVTILLHYLFIGGISGCVLNLVCTARNITYSTENKNKYLTIVFAVAMGILGVVSWQGWYSLFVIAGLVINTLCLALKNPQSNRKSILVTSPLIIVYDVIVKSYGGIILESVVIISSVIGLIRYRKENL